MHFRVVHPLDDVAEMKCSAESLGPLEMTRSARWCLIALRVYLIAMALLLAYHVLDVAGLLQAQR